MLEHLLEVLPFLPFVIGRTRPTVVPNPFGEALAASTGDIVNMFFQQRRIELQEERLDEAEKSRMALERDRAMARDLQRMEVLLGTAEPGVPLGGQNPVIQEAVSSLIGRDVTQDPSLANMQVNPLSPDDKLTQATFDYLEELEETDPDAAALFKQELSLDRPIAEVRADETEASQRTRLLTMANSVVDRVAEGEGDPADTRFVRNMLAQATGTEGRVQAIGPNGQTMEVDETIASTLVSQWWQAAREGQATEADTVQAIGESLITAMDNLGVQIDLGLATQIVTATQEGDMETLQQLAARGPAANLAVQTSIQGRTGVDGFAQLFVQGLPQEIRPNVQRAMGQLSALRQTGLPSEQLRETAERLTESIKAAAEEADIDPETLSLITDPSALMDIAAGAGVGAATGTAIGMIPGSIGGVPGALAGGIAGGIVGLMTGGNTGFQLGQPGQGQGQGQGPAQGPGQGSISIQDLLQRDSQGGGEPPLSDRDRTLGQVLRNLRTGSTSLATARREHDLTPEEIRTLGRLLRESREQ